MIEYPTVPTGQCQILSCGLGAGVSFGLGAGVEHVDHVYGCAVRTDREAVRTDRVVREAVRTDSVVLEGV